MIFLFKSFEERVAQQYIFQEYFKENQIAERSDYANEDHKITLRISSLCLFGRPIAPSQYETGTKKK